MRLIGGGLLAFAMFLAGETQTIPEVGPIVSNLGSIGFLVWYCWHVTSKVIPQMHADFREDLKSVLKEHREAVESMASTIQRTMEQCQGRKPQPGGG